MSASCVPSPSPQPSSARLQTKNTFLRDSSNIGQVATSLSSGGLSKRTRTTSASSVDTIRVNTGKKKTSSKKRARANEFTSNPELDQNLLENQRRIRQRKVSTESSDIAFPTVDAINQYTPSSGDEKRSINGKKSVERKVTPPKLNPGHCAPLVAVTADNRAVNNIPQKLEASPPTAMRQAPPPPLITHTVRSRLQSIKRPSRPSSPSYHAMRTPYHRYSGFEPLPDHLQDWQPSSAPHVLSDDEYSAGTPSSPGTEWRYQRDNIHPGISDLDLAITFHKKQPFFDVWDLPDDIYIAVPATLHLTLRNPREWNEISSEPDLRYIDIKASTFDYRPLSEYFPPEYTVSYTGASSTEYADPSIVPADLTRGIIVNKKWHYSGSRNRFRESLITNYGRLPDDSIESETDGDDEDVSLKRGWFFKFMIPIPSWVLRQGNTRAFTVEASAWVGGIDDGGLVRGDTELVISHLRSEREMIKGC